MKRAVALTLAAGLLAVAGLEPVAAQEPSGASACTGPKKRVAVLRFGAAGKLGATEGWDVGDGLAAQMATALEEAGCFIVVERQALSNLLREQELAAVGIVAKESAAKVGALVGAQILIKGDITEFEPTSKGSGVTVGLGFLKLPLGLRLGGEAQTAHVALDIRLLDASTGHVLQSHRVEAKARGAGVGVGVDAQVVSVGGDHFFKTPVGQATRQAISKAVALVHQSVAAIPWAGRVVEILDGKLYLNAGTDAQIKVGDTFVVSTMRKDLIDPDSGLSLGALEEKLGDVRVEEVQEKFAVARPLGDFQPKRGDLVRPKAATF